MLKDITGSTVNTTAVVNSAKFPVSIPCGMSLSAAGSINNPQSADVPLNLPFEASANNAEQVTIDLSNHIALINPIRYRGYYYDQETCLYYLQSRYYDPEVGRFINADDVSYLDPENFNGLNLYAYCGNNPVMLIDENGKSWKSFWKGLVSTLAIIGGTVLCFVPGAQRIGAGLIATGAGGLIGGFTSMAMGGDFSSGWDVGTIIGGTIGLIIAAPQLLSLVSKIAIPTFGTVLTSAGTTAIAATGTAIISIPIGAIAVGASAIGLGMLFAKLPMHGEPNSKVESENSVGTYDENGNLISRKDLSGRPHFIKELNGYFLPHTHQYEWQLVKDIWRIIRKTILPF